jgi:regulator of protease activity HflC (stomatin/prohibitin superfamily)
MGFEWLNKLMTELGAWIPRIGLMKVTHRGVKHSRGGSVTPIQPGLYMWWPLISQIDELAVVRQTLSFRQRLTTKDTSTVLVETVIIYTLDDIEKACVETWDYEDTIGEAAQRSTIKSVMSRTFDQIKEDLAGANRIPEEITEICLGQLSQFGVHVEEAFISNFCKTNVFSHDGTPVFAGTNPEE